MAAGQTFFINDAQYIRSIATTRKGWAFQLARWRAVAKEVGAKTLVLFHHDRIPPIGIVDNS